MMSQTIRSSLVLLLAGAAPLLCGAAVPAPRNPPPTAKPATVAPRERPLRDPTLPGPALRSLIAKPAGGPVAAVPTVELKGRILAGPRRPMVTLAVGSQLHMVPEGSKIGLAGAGEIRVTKVTAEVVELQVLPMDYTLTLH